MFVVWKIVQGIDRTTVKLCDLSPAILEFTLHSRIVFFHIAMNEGAIDVLFKENLKVLSATHRHL
jgi:hypothetical protein